MASKNSPEPAEGAEAQPVTPDAPVEGAPAEETPAEETSEDEDAVDPELYDYREVDEGVQARVMTDSERSTRAVS